MRIERNRKKQMFVSYLYELSPFFCILSTIKDFYVFSIKFFFVYSFYNFKFNRFQRPFSSLNVWEQRTLSDWLFYKHRMKII